MHTAHTCSARLYQPAASRTPRPVFTTALAALLAALLVLSGLLAPARAHAQDGSGQLGPDAQAIANAINGIRVQNGLNALIVHPLLTLAAQNHVDDLIAHNMYGHYGSDGSSVRQRVLRTGYPSGMVSENWVTAGSTEGAMTWWMNDWIHKVNILDASWDEVGVGVGQLGNGYYIYVTDFANADGKDTSVAVAPPAEAAAVAEAAPESLPAAGMDYTIRGGDTLLAIGLRYGVEWQDIAQANNIGERSILQIGKVLHIPGRGGETAARTAVATGGLLYTVVAGDTLTTIGARYEIDWHDVEAANGLSAYSVLQIGMQLRLPGVPEADEADAAAGDAQAEAAPDDAEDAAPAFAQTVGASYTVQSGDTLFSIAARNHMTVDDLAALNDLGDGALLQIGQTLDLPADALADAGSPAPAAADAVPAAKVTVYTTELLPAPAGAAAGGGSYTVQPGDTISSIAAKHGMAWKELLRINGFDEDTLLQPGQIISLGG